MQTLRNKKIYVESYGCTFNHADTEKLIETAVEQGCVQVPAEDADVFVINTCTVIGATERTMLRRISEFADNRKEVLIVVTGCMPVIQADLIRSVCPDSHIILPEELYRCNMRVGALTMPGVGVVQMGTGCLGRCSYCITRSARGRLKSFSESTIVAEVERLVSLGAGEIQLTGQDVSAYGLDCGTNLAELLYAINEIPGDFSVRVGMMNPATVIPILDELVPAFALKKIFSFVHMPVQSGSDHVLDTMNRGYHAEDFVKIVDAFRAEMPDVRISTDFIVGFPTETDEDFAETLSLIRRTRPGKVNITRFSTRPGTDAEKYHDLPDRIKKDRSRLLTKTANAIYDEVNESYVGRVPDVRVTEQKKAGSVVARDHSYMNIVVMEELPVGSVWKVRVTGHHRHYLIAEKL
ncbi:MAG: tRNA (N(6)-L-threonylcarbamoyladenosine(37)-C(2))-methylthiotransferase [Euryarchaeota archaeon]|nr:tRNA (N(6)-L-threonylcarbamoyladenosine(37)-C(2))-methylthiotransferase [Euryarchaeota archaeon]